MNPSKSTKILLIFIISLLVIIGIVYMAINRRVPIYGTENNNIRKNQWELIKSSIANCEVEEVMQTHSQYVTAKLKDGRLIEGTEPTIDNIIDLAVEAKGKCGEIMMATE